MTGRADVIMMVASMFEPTICSLDSSWSGSLVNPL